MIHWVSVAPRFRLTGSQHSRSISLRPNTTDSLQVFERIIVHECLSQRLHVLNLVLSQTTKCNVNRINFIRGSPNTNNSKVCKKSHSKCMRVFLPATNFATSTTFEILFFFKLTVHKVRKSHQGEPATIDFDVQNFFHSFVFLEER